MSAGSRPSGELLDLVAAFRDEALTPDQQRRLQDLLQRDADARDYFLRFMTLHALLETRFPAAVSDKAESETDTVTDVAHTTGQRQSRWRTVAWITALTLAASLLIAVTSYLLRSPPSITPNSTGVATISHLANVAWTPDSPVYSFGDPISSGHIRLKAGMIRLSYGHGVVVTIEGPADFEILTRDKAVLHQGRLAAYVPDGAEGFRVATPNANVVDLGTEFGLTVSDRGETELSVFDGKVELTPTVPRSKTQVVESGLAFRVDVEGKTHQELIGLAPYLDARDSLCRWRMIWEPFGPGSGQPFPGRAGRGWLNAWSMDVQGGSLVSERTGILDEPTLFPGTEMYLGLTAIANEATESCRVTVSRSFGSIDQFTTAAPYTIEFLLRLDCGPSDVRRIRVFGVLQEAVSTERPVWQLEANHASPKARALAWRLDDQKNGAAGSLTLPVRRGMTFRCFVEVHPQLGLWRATVSNRRVSISNSLSDARRFPRDASGSMTLGVEVEGEAGSEVRLSLDAIRIQNRPNALPTTMN